MTPSTTLSPPTITLVTGGSRGLGRNTALSIARDGGDVIITYRSQAEEAQAAVAEIQALGRRAVALQLDTGNIAAFVTFTEHLRAALQTTWQRTDLDNLVNNAGHGDFAAFATTSETQFDHLVNVHFKGVFFITQALLPLIADGGRIVNFSTGLTHLSLPGYAAYAAAKGAVEVLTRYLAKELGARGISVTAVGPGPMDTPFFYGQESADAQAYHKSAAALSAFSKTGLTDIEDVVPFIRHLVSDGWWVTGQTILINGGYTTK